MSPNRKADLQRKLAMAPLPKPPAGLAERIKTDIPKHLLVDVQKERQRLSQGIAFNLRVAASVLFLVMSVYLALYVLSRGEKREAVVARASNPAAQAAKPQALPPGEPQGNAENVPQPLSVPAPPKVAADDRKQVMVAEAKPEELARPERVQGGNVGGVAGGTVGANLDNEAAKEAAAAPPPPPPAAAAASAAPAAPAVAESAPVQAQAPMAKAEAKRSTASGFISDAYAGGLPLTSSSLFDIPLKKDKLDGVALIEHFAAPPAAPHSLRLDAEATTLAETRLLRVSVDLPEAHHPPGSSLPPVAADAKLEIELDDANVVSHRAIVGSTSATESVLPSGGSVTALFAIELKPDLSRRATLATVRLRYRSVVDGKEHEITRKVRRSDLRDWQTASRRMKATALAAALVEKLEPAETIAEQARAAHLDELAALAERR